MAWEVAVQTLDESEYPSWEKLVAAAPGGSVYSLPEYLDTLCTAAGGRFEILVARRGDELVGGVALYERGSWYGTYVSPRLLLYYNGLVVRRYDAQYPSENTARQVKILTALEAALAASRHDSVNLRSRALPDLRPFLARGWSAAPSYSYVVGLDLGAAWGRVEQNLRRLIERAESQGLTFAEDDDFDAFHRLHASTLERHGAGPYLPYGAFRDYFATLRRRSLGRLFHVRAPDGRAVASQLVLLGPHAVSHTVCAGADPAFNRLGASAYLRWQGFVALAGLGYQANDLTDASLNPVTHFKSQLGGTLELSLVLQSSQSRRFRWGRGLVDAGERLRERAGALARRLRHRDEGDA